MTTPLFSSFFLSWTCSCEELITSRHHIVSAGCGGDTSNNKTDQTTWRAEEHSDQTRIQNWIPPTPNCKSRRKSSSGWARRRWDTIQIKNESTQWDRKKNNKVPVFHEMKAKRRCFVEPFKLKDFQLRVWLWRRKARIPGNLKVLPPY